MGFNLARLGVGLATGGLSELAGEDTMARIPLLGGLMGSKTDAQKALLKKQEEMAKEAKKRMQLNQESSMQALGQSMLAFNPLNQAMAEMYGPEAAFTPQAMAQMVQNPNGPPQLGDPSSQSELGPARDRSGGRRERESSPSLQNYQGLDPKKQAEVEEWLRQKAAYERQQQTVLQGFQQPGPGAAPLQQRTPQAGRRY